MHMWCLSRVFTINDVDSTYRHILKGSMAAYFLNSTNVKDVVVANFHLMLSCLAIIAVAGESQLSVLIFMVVDLLFISETSDIVKQLYHVGTA